MHTLLLFVIDPEFVIVLLLMVGLIAVVVGVVDLVVDSEPAGVLWMMIVLMFALEGRREEGARVADQEWLLVLVIRAGWVKVNLFVVLSLLLLWYHFGRML